MQARRALEAANGLDSTYEGLKPGRAAVRADRGAGLDSTYEGLKLFEKAASLERNRVWTVPMRA